MSAPLVTPSARSHERVTGRWVRDIEAIGRGDWAAYYAKLVFGSLVPWLMTLMAASVFLSRASVEITAWGSAALCALYILVDLFSRTREFRFFRVGGDLMLLGLFAVGLIGAISVGTSSGSFAKAADAVGALRWIPLLYLLAYAWELFPGLNRAYGVMAVCAAACSLVAIWQNFAGLDILTGAALEHAPGIAKNYFCATGFFDSPEALGTALAVFLPLPTMAFLIGERRDPVRWAALGLSLLIALGLFFTYRPGLWMAGGAGLFVSLLMPGRRQWAIAVALVTMVLFVILALFHSPGDFSGGVVEAQRARSARQRVQIDQQVKIWSQSPWIGSGLQSVEAAQLDSTVGNVYFQILAQMGALGLSFYLIFCLSFLLGAYRILQEVPRTHYWHRVLVSGGIAGIVAFHAAGLFWFTLSEALSANLFVFHAGALGYVHEHYGRGLVTDDRSL